MMMAASKRNPRREASAMYAFSERDEPPVERPAFLHSQPGETRRCTAIRIGDAARIEPAKAVRSLVARYVRMPVQDHIAIGGSPPRGDVLEMEPYAFAFEPQHERPAGMIVIVAQHDAQRRAELLDLHQRLRRANITEMPDLVSTGQEPWKFRRVAVVRVSKDCDAHDGIHGRTHISGRLTMGAA